MEKPLAAEWYFWYPSVAVAEKKTAVELAS